ncbi:MAG: Diaminopimelate epimerase [Chlamydiae bacterium]|nr:Diaminopimelate epimerase [Chlamydiota bacterium]
MLSFSKYVGLGNDFIFVDCLTSSISLDQETIKSLCNRYEGIGADGLILVLKSQVADCRMRIFNADGSEAEMCGNALRCFYPFLKSLGISKEVYQIETKSSLLEISKQGSDILCEMGDVSQIVWDIELVLDEKKTLKGHFLNTGVPHFVIPTSNLARLPVLPLGHYVRNHPQFAPEGTNVNFISLNQDKVIEIRTYERGVESETQACGTGCAAAAIVGHFLFGLAFPIQVKPLHGGVLKFNFDTANGQIKNLKMLGPALFVFKGEIPLPIAAKNTA